MFKPSSVFYFSLFLILCFCSSFYSQPDHELIVPKVNKDLSWIKQYTSIYNLFNQDQWEKNPTRSFDSLGVHLTKKYYHPVNASHYALFCYDEYLNGKNEKYKKAFLAQVSYLRDCTKYNEIEGDKVGYPYLMTFHDLKAPWYSSLAQAEVISVLIRYYAMTSDASVLPLIVQVKNFMVAPMKNGGCLSITPEGLEWLEEYPNSKQEIHNFSGYYIAVLALGEYSKLFPTDSSTMNLYKRCLNNGKINNKIYDTGSGIMYNRGDKRLCAPGYIKWMTNLMQHMAEFTGDEFFKYQHMIWSTYSYGKDYVDVGVKKDYYNWSIPIVKTEENKFICTAQEEKLISNINIKELKLDNKVLPASLVFDNNIKTSIRLSKIETSAGTDTISILFTKEVLTGSIELDLIKDPVVRNIKINFFYKADTAGKWNRIKEIKSEVFSNAICSLKFEKLKINELKIVIEEKSLCPLSVGEIKISEEVKVDDPEFCFYKTGTLPVINETANLSCEFESGINHWIFFRSGNTAKDVGNSAFPAADPCTKSNLTLNIKNKFIEYLIICDYKKSSNGMKKLIFE
jgi:hypothetical protein